MAVPIIFWEKVMSLRQNEIQRANDNSIGTVNKRLAQGGIFLLVAVYLWKGVQSGQVIGDLIATVLVVMFVMFIVTTFMSDMGRLIYLKKMRVIDKLDLRR